MTKAAKKALRISRAAQQADNYAVNKYVRDLERQLASQGYQIESLKKELSQLKQDLKTAKAQLRTEKKSHAETKLQLEKVKNVVIKGLKVPTKQLGNMDPERLAKEAIRKAVTSGPFDSYTARKGWRKSAIAAGNRLEKVYPGFFQAMKLLETKGVDVLQFIVSYYNLEGEGHRGELYENDEYHVVTEDYQLLCRVAKEQYDVDLPGSAF